MAPKHDNGDKVTLVESTFDYLFDLISPKFLLTISIN